MLSLFPIEANQPHDVRSIFGKLAKKGAITHLTPYVVHAIQLSPAAMVLLSKHEEVDKEAMDFIMIGILGVNNVAVDAVHDIIGGEEGICTTAKRSTRDVEVDHLVLAHGLRVKMNLEGVEVVVVELIAKTMRKLCPSGSLDIPKVCML
jgi:hypothetical protein